MALLLPSGLAVKIRIFVCRYKDEATTRGGCKCVPVAANTKKNPQINFGGFFSLKYRGNLFDVRGAREAWLGDQMAGPRVQAVGQDLICGGWSRKSIQELFKVTVAYIRP